MEPTEIPFLKVNEQSISLGRTLDYLRSSGGYHRMMTDIFRQYLLEKELQNRADIQFNELQVDQALMDFRVQNNLVEPQQFQEWMQSNDVDYQKFRQDIVFGFKVEQLKKEVTEPKLEEYFQEKKPFLDRVVLSRLILDDPSLAETLKQKIASDPSQFESLVREHSLTDDRTINGMMGVIPKGQMPDILRAALDATKPGNLIGPLELEGRYCLFRLEQVLPASLDEEPLKQELKNQLFEQWLQEKLQALDIRLEVK